LPSASQGPAHSNEESGTMTGMSRRELLRLGLYGPVSVAVSGCGTVLHPERRGQPAGPLDWKIVALDTLGLLLFFIPGVIAFAVDFNNGTIYLPPEDCGDCSNRDVSLQLTPRRLKPGQLNRESLEQLVSEHVNRRVRLEPGACQTRPLNRIEEFDEAREELAAGYSRV